LEDAVQAMTIPIAIAIAELVGEEVVTVNR
jgi:hypothetical protein